MFISQNKIRISRKILSRKNNIYEGVKDSSAAKSIKAGARRQKNMLAWSDADLPNYLLKRRRNDI